MSFLKELFGLNDPVLEYQTFSDYMTEEPLDVFYNNQKIGTIDKEVQIVDYTDKYDIMQTLPTTVYTIKYKKSDLDNLLESYGVKNVTAYKIFNGSDIAIYTSRPPRQTPITVELPIKLAVDDTNIQFSSTYSLEISETTSNIIQYEISQDILYDKLLDEFLATQPLLEFLSVEDTSMEDNTFTCVLANHGKHEKSVYVNDKYYIDVDVDITVTDNKLHDADFSRKALTEIFNANDIYKYYNITKINQNKSLSDKGLPVIDVAININYDTIDSQLATIITTYTDFLESKGYQIGDLKGYFLVEYSEGYITDSKLPDSTVEDITNTEDAVINNELMSLKQDYDENDGLAVESVANVTVGTLKELNEMIENPYSFSSYSTNVFIDDDYVATIESEAEYESANQLESASESVRESEFESELASQSESESVYDSTSESISQSESDSETDLESETVDTIEILSEKGKD